MAEIERVPRSETEEAEILRRRPPGWEYLLLGGVLLCGKKSLEPRWQVQTNGAAPLAASVLSDRESLDALGNPFPQLLAIADDLHRHLSPGSQELAFGRLGEDGNPDRIRKLAEGIIDDYHAFFDWAARMRGLGVSPRFQPVAESLARYVDVPLREIREWIDQAVAAFDRLPAALRSGTPITLNLTLKLSIDEATSQRLRAELQSAHDQMNDEAKQLDEETRRLTLARAVAVLEHPPATAPTVIDRAPRTTPADVRREVWRRDRGRCVDCGSRERLEFDHIVPWSAGGSSTARNIELRCESCNRRKAATI